MVEIENPTEEVLREPGSFSCPICKRAWTTKREVTEHITIEHQGEIAVMSAVYLQKLKDSGKLGEVY